MYGHGQEFLLFYRTGEKNLCKTRTHKIFSPPNYSIPTPENLLTDGEFDSDMCIDGRPRNSRGRDFWVSLQRYLDMIHHPDYECTEPLPGPWTLPLLSNYSTWLMISGILGTASLSS